MADISRLFDMSLTGDNPFEKRLTRRFELADLFTFSENRTEPIYNWFHYKEGYSKDFVTECLHKLKVPADGLVVDPFCGTGTTLLAAQDAGFSSSGLDVLPLGVFVSRVKLVFDYDVELLRAEALRLTSSKYSPPKSKLVDVRFIDMRKVYTPYARNDVAFFRERILEVQDESTRNFLMLGLISIVGQASNVMKDGGVLRIVRKKHIPPVRHLLKAKLKRMIKELRQRGMRPAAQSSVNVGDARDMPLEDGSVDALITSPPYLNFVDYTKVYALELSLLVESTQDLENLRRTSLRSHISAQYDSGGKEDDIVSSVLGRVTRLRQDDKVPGVVEGYLRDMCLVLKETKRVLRPGGAAVFVVGNASLPSVTVDVDVILGEMGERLGLTLEDIWVGNVRWAGVHGIEKERPARESAVILRKMA